MGLSVSTASTTPILRSLPPEGRGVMTATVRDRLLSVLDAALQYDGNVVEPPVALLWPDTARQWEQIVDALREVRRIVRLGDHDLARAQGPAYWVRCVVVGAIKLGGDPDGVPIIYMPGVSRDDVRTLASTTLDLAPLAAIQHRSHWFTHPNGKDWTVRALFGQKDRGLGLSVAGDDGTASALIGSLPQLLGQPLSRLEGRYLDATFLNGLLNPDLVRLLLQWFDDPKTTEHLLGDAAWKAFVQQCRTEYDFDPPRHGVIEGAQRLGSAEGPWAQVWQRFRESPADYPEIPSRLREAQPALLLLPNQGAWPTPAADAENALRAQLIGVAGATSGDARAAVLALEEEHKARRGYVWADLGWTPLTLALEHLGEIARRTASATPTSSVSAIADWYAEGGWQVDRAVLSALEEVDPHRRHRRSRGCA